jgi:hypothetical protein
MKKLFIIALLIPLLISCRKTVISPEGPTDVRIRNLSGSVLNDIVVKIEEEEIEFGTLEVNGISNYHRFKTAFPKAFISAKVNGDSISTGAVDYTYMNYFGRVKMTYDILIENNLLKINNVTLDSAL